jgi:hypothetical protein
LGAVHAAQPHQDDRRRLNVAVRDELIEATLIKDLEEPAGERREKILTGEKLQKLLVAARELFKALLHLIVARLTGHSDARMLRRTYFREDMEAMVEAMGKSFRSTATGDRKPLGQVFLHRSEPETHNGKL